MKKISVILLLLGIVIISSAQSPQNTSIKFEGDGFEKRTFDNKALLFTNKKYKAQEIPAAFRDFQFLANQGGLAEEGIIIPENNGLIYIIAPAGINVEGWQPVDNSEFTYDDAKKSKLAIYQKQVKAGKKIHLPEVARFAGVTPIAPSIQYGFNNAVAVEGKLIDTWKVQEGAFVFSQNSTFKFKKPLPDVIVNKKYAVSLIENPGASKVKSENGNDILIALHYNTLTDNNWQYTGESFAISSARTYYLYKYKNPKTGVWIDVPQPLKSGAVAPTLVFGDDIMWANPSTVPGIIITRSQDPKNVYITNPSIVILPDGRYLASCSGAFRVKGGEKGGVSFFISSDKGKTWKEQSRNSVEMTFCNLFVHNGVLYLMGTNRGYKDAVIAKSYDWGITWTTPADDTTGLLLTGGFYHSAPVPVVIHNGRIWRAMENAEDSKGKNKRALVMSAPVDADLLKASSWTKTNELSFSVPEKVKEGHEFKQWLEGNVVLDREGNVVNVLRVDELKEGGFAAITHMSGTTKLAYNSEKDLIRMPGGGVKFTIRLDSVSNKYWAITNAIQDEDRTKTHSGKYKTGVHASLLRNRAALIYSDDLVHWKIKEFLISTDNPFFYGFQYTDWQFDGKDIIAVIRTAYEEERGLPMRQHDANFFTFYRVENFREAKK
ncbi:MAG: exo-alpha-sialidase [Paludibacteraceae bacterium]